MGFEGTKEGGCEGRGGKGREGGEGGLVDVVGERVANR